MSLKVSPRRLQQLATVYLVGLLLVSFYYLAYRYPFRINDAGTSSTYTDTPLWLQAGKYALLLCFALVVTGLGVRYWSRQSMSRPIARLPLVAACLLAVLALAKGVAYGAVNLIEVGFMFAVVLPLILLSAKWAIDTAALTLTIRIFTLIAVVINGAQIVLFFTTGRLPALGYENSTSVRFGSVFDDPNGFAILIPMLVPVILLWTRIGFWRFIVVALLGVSLVLTQSFTGVAAAAGALCVGFVAINWGNWKRVIIFVVSVALAGAAALLVLLNSQTFLKVVDSKAGSMEAHSGSLDVLAELTGQSLLGYGPPLGGVESSYVSLAVNFGLLFTIAYSALGIWAVTRYYKAIRSAEHSRDVASYYGFFFFLVGYLITSFNLQAEAMFPANLVYAIAIGVAFFVRIESGADPLASRRAAHRASRRGQLMPPRRALR